MLKEAGVQIAPSTYYAAHAPPPSARAVRDEQLCEQIMKVYNDNYRVYGARKVWRQLLRDDVPVARCTVERLMRRLGIAGVRRRKIRRTTVCDPAQPKPCDLLKRDFTATAPNTRWVVDFTYT